MMNLVIVLVSMMVSQAWAGGSAVENGGTYVLCPQASADPQIFHRGIAVLDIFDGRNHAQLNYRQLSSYRGEALETAYPKAIKRFFGRSQGLQHRMLAAFKHFNTATKFVPEHTLPWLNTPSLPAWLAGCRVHPAAVQSVDSRGLGGDAVPLRIGREPWKAMGTDQKIALLVHEYLQATIHRIVPSCTAGKIRALVGQVLSDEAAGYELTHWSYLFPSLCEENSTSP